MRHLAEMRHLADLLISIFFGLSVFAVIGILLSVWIMNLYVFMFSPRLFPLDSIVISAGAATACILVSKQRDYLGWPLLGFVHPVAVNVLGFPEKFSSHVFLVTTALCAMGWVLTFLLYRQVRAR